MKLAIDIAEKGRGKCSPNPFVGAVIVKNDKIIGQGFTQVCGQDHAEIQALKTAGTEAKDADIYVSLEPCSHYGKTPPCAEALIKAGIKNVYAGIKDPNPKVNGTGFAMLKQAGINVEYGFFSEVISQQIEYYLKWIQTGKPFIIMKNAVSLDGKIAADNGTSKWITNEKSRMMVHQLREEVDAVLTTINTVKKDNPILNVRKENPYKHPVRVILDNNLDIDFDSNICKTSKEIDTIIFYDDENIDSSKIPKLQELGINLIKTKRSADKNFLDLEDVLLKLGSMKISSLMTEAGTALNSYLLKNKFVDKLYYFIAPVILGGSKSVFNHLNIADISDKIKLTNYKTETVDNDILVIAYPDYE